MSIKFFVCRTMVMFIVASVFVVAAVEAQPVTLDFNDTLHAANGYDTVNNTHGEPSQYTYSSGGFTLTIADLSGGGLGGWGSASPNFLTDPVIASGSSGTYFELTADNGNVFAVHSIDVIDFAANQAAANIGNQVTFYGIKPDNSVVSSTFSFQTAVFDKENHIFAADFTGLSSFVWNQNSAGEPPAPVEFATANRVHMVDNLSLTLQGPPPEQPKLVVNRDTGAILIENNSGMPLNLLGYSIRSISGALDQAAWTSISGNYDAIPANGGTGNGSVDMDDKWTVLTAAGVVTDLSESELAGGDGGTISNGQSVDLGTPWMANPFGASDLSIRLLLDDGTQRDIDIEFSGADVISGDIAGATVNDASDGNLDVIDWLDFRANQNTDMSSLSLTQAYQRGDLDGDLDSDLSDFTQFAAAYNAINGPGSFQAMVASVPEPTSIALILAAGLVLVATRRSLLETLGVKIPLVLAGAFLLNLLGPMNAHAALDGFRESSSFNHVYTPADIVGGVDGWNSTGLIGGAVGNGADFFVNGSGQLEYNTTVDGGGVWVQQNASPSVWLDEVGADTSYTLEARFKFEAPTVPGDHSLTLLMTNSSGQGILFFINDNGSTVPGDANDNADEFHDYRFAFDAEDDVFHVWRDTVPLTDASGLAASTPGGSQRLVFGDGSSAITSGTVLAEFIRVDTTGAYSAFAEPELTLVVNKTTGAVAIVNDGTPAIGNVDFNAYSIRSAAGALDFSAWASLQSIDLGGNGVPNDGIGSEQFEESDDHYLSEAFLTGFSSLDEQDAPLTLGQAFDTSVVFPVGVDGDLQFSYTDGEGVLRVGKVSYVTSIGLPGDFNGDMVVDAADYTVWRDNLGGDESALLGNGNNSGTVDAGDYTLWKSSFGDTAGSGSGSVTAAAVPEPSSVALLLVVAFAGICLLRREGGRFMQRSRQAIASSMAVLLLSIPAFATENDRQYDLGDEEDEMAMAGNTVGSAVGHVTYDSAGTVGAGDLQDLQVNGAPTYVSVSDRPGAGGLDLGADFNSASADSLSTNKSMNAPAQFWDNSTFFPGPPPLIFPHNYERIFSHGIQLWAKPDQSALGVNTQTLISDTGEHGIGITDTGNWSLLFDDGRFDSEVSVASTLDPNGWAHVMEIAGFSDPIGGRTATGGALLVNGVAVAARGTPYDPEATELVLGANSNGSGGYENHYDGVLDDVRIFFWGDNSGELGQDGVAGGSNSGGPLPTPIVLNADGRDWGPLNLAVDNDWIAQQLASMGATDSADVNLDGEVFGDGSGMPEVDDVTAFVNGWLSVREVDGIQIGDWVSRQDGDLNFDGITDLGDAYILHQGLIAAGQAGLNFNLLTGVNVPEPSSIALVFTGLFAIRRLRRSVNKLIFG